MTSSRTKATEASGALKAAANPAAAPAALAARLFCFDTPSNRARLEARLLPILNRRAFAPKTLPAADADDSREEFDRRYSAGRVPKFLPKSEFDLRNAAAGRSRRDLHQSADDQRRDDNYAKADPEKMRTADGRLLLEKEALKPGDRQLKRHRRQARRQPVEKGSEQRASFPMHAVKNVGDGSHLHIIKECKEVSSRRLRPQSGRPSSERRRPKLLVGNEGAS